MNFEEFFFDYSLNELFRQDGFIREFFSDERKIQLLVDRDFRVRKLYLINFVEPDVVWLVLPGSGFSAYRVEREEEEKFYYSGGVLGTRVHLDLPKDRLRREVSEVLPAGLRAKVCRSLETDDLRLEEPEFMAPFLTYYVEGTAVYDANRTLVGARERAPGETERLRRFFQLTDRAHPSG